MLMSVIVRMIGGVFCKHKVGLLFAIEEYLERQTSGCWDGELEVVVKNRIQPKPKKTQKKRATVTEKLQQTIASLPPEQVAEMLLEAGLSDKSLREKILRKIPIEFDPKHFAKSLKDYAQQIKKSIRSVARDGFVGYWEAQQAVEASFELLDAAEIALSKKDYSQALCIALANMQTLYAEIERVDDSDGEFGDAIESAKDIFEMLSQAPLPEADRQHFFAVCLAETDNESYDGWGEKYNFLDWALAVLCVDNQDEIDTFTQTLERCQTQDCSDHMRDYYLKNYVELAMELARKQGKDQEAIALRDRYLYLPEFRQQKIDELNSVKDYKTVEIMLKEGIELANEKQHIGNRRTWEDQLLLVYGDLGQTAKQIQLMEERFFRDRDWKMFDQLQKTLAKNQTQAFHQKVEQIFEKDSEVLCQFYSRTNQIEKLGNSVQKIITKPPQQTNAWRAIRLDPLAWLEKYEPQLREYDTGWLIQSYLNGLEYLLRKTGRDNYAKTAQILRRIETFAPQEAIPDFVKKMLKTYSNRPAMREEFRDFL